MPKKKSPPAAPAIGHNEQAVLRDFATELNAIQDAVEAATEKHLVPLREQRKAVFDKAKAEGFNARALREVVRKSRMDEDLRADIDLYDGHLLNDILG